MANNKVQMKYDLCQNNVKDSVTNGKWYPRVSRTATLDLDGLCDHIAGHGSIYTGDVVAGVLKKLSSCLIELVGQGIAVKINGLGTFHPTLEAEGAESPVDYSLAKCLKGVHIRFTPDGTSRNKITSRAFMEKVSLTQHMLYDRDGKPKMVKDGQVVDYVKGGGSDDDNGDGGGNGNG